MKQKFDCIIWDWNGTLVDDVYVALNSVNDMLTKRDKAPITIQQYYSYLDTPISKFYEHIFTPDEITFDTIAKEFSLGYEKYLSKQPIFSGVEKVLSQVKAKGGKQLIISSSAQTKVENDVKKFGLYNYFDIVSGADNHHAESKINRANRIVNSVCPANENLLVIGDTLHDYQMAQTLNAHCILFSKGHQSKEDLLKTGKPVIDNFSQLCDYVEM